MYNLKKVIASICVIAMMLTTVAIGATYSDIEGTAYYEAVETLNKLEIVNGYDDGTYKPENGVTRAEMAALIARIQGYGDTAAGSAVTSFEDVPASHWASGYIANAASSGIIDGYGNGKFGPEDPVLYEQAVKMVMATLGYTPYAENNGGYPGGYLAAAQRYSVANGVSNATMGTQANRGTIAQLLVNAIDTPLMAQKSWSTNGEAEYVIYDGSDSATPLRTLMSANLGFVKLRGVVTANPYTALASDVDIDTTKDATITLDVTDNFDTDNKDFAYDKDDNYDGKTEFLVGGTDAADYLGKSVIIYVKELDNNDYEVVSIAEDTARNKILEIDPTQFSKINGTKFEYMKSETAKTATAVTLDSKAKVVYNYDGNYKVEDIFGDEIANNGATKDGGKITLIDNNTTNGYDVIFVELAETAVVKKAEEGYVTFQAMTTVSNLMDLTIDEEDETVIVNLTKDGEAFAAADLVEWDVLSIIANNDQTYINAEVISNAVVGAVKSVSDSDKSATGKAYSINGTKYDVANGAYGRNDLAIGVGGTFYINKYGKIAAFNEDGALATGVASNYAYVTSTAVEADTLTGEKTAIVQMVTAEGLVALNVKTTNATIDGAKFEAKSDTEKTVGERVTSEKLYALEGTIVKYVKNTSDLITDIQTANYSKSKFEAVVDSKVSKTYDADSYKFVDGKYIDADALVFFINTADATENFLGSVADLEDEVKYDILKIYADDKAEDNNILVVEISTGISPKTNMGVLTDIGTSENENGELIYVVEAIVNGETIVAETTHDAANKIPAYDEDTDKGISVGDIVKVKLGSNGVIAALEIVYDFGKGVRDLKTAYTKAEDLAKYDVAVTAPSNNGDETFAGGKVTKYKDSSSEATFGSKTVKLSQAKNVYVIDANGNNLEIKQIGASNFKVFEALYEDADTDVKVTIGSGDAKKTFAATSDQAQYAADYVYTRSYDGKVVDVVIVKGREDVRVVD